MVAHRKADRFRLHHVPPNVASSIRGTALALLLSASAFPACTQNPLENPPVEPPTLIVDGHIALGALITLGDGHIRDVANGLQLLIESDVLRSNDWSTLHRALTQLEKVTVPATLWAALPDGSYPTMVTGQVEPMLPAPVTLAAVWKGESVIGKMVENSSTSEKIALVALPVFDRDGSVAVILGASIHLAELSLRLRKEMSLDGHLIFYAFDSERRVALRSPQEGSWNGVEEAGDIDRLYTEASTRQQGIVRYRLQRQVRTFLYRQSPLNDWWYALGAIHPE